MQRSKVLVVIGGALLLYALYASHQSSTDATPADPAPVTKPARPNPAPAKPKQPCPRWPHKQAEAVASDDSHRPQLGGLISPDGKTSALPLPDHLQWPRNIASHGLGLCSFRSLDYGARFQNVPELVDLPEKMRDAGIAGGGFPDKVDRIIQQFAPGVAYFNDTSKSWALLAAVLASQRIACIDYNGRDPHYGSGIAHCVCVIAFDAAADWVAILDNNFPALDQIVWMSRSELDQRWGGWCYGLLAVTPGLAQGHYTEESWTPRADENGTFNYGLTTESGPWPGSSVLNGQPSSTDEIIDAVGPEMGPIKVNVDHKVEPFDLKIDPNLIALAGGAALMLAVFSRRDE